MQQTTTKLTDLEVMCPITGDSESVTISTTTIRTIKDDSQSSRPSVVVFNELASCSGHEACWGRVPLCPLIDTLDTMEIGK